MLVHECNGKTCTKSTPAIPPSDYKGSQADWMVGLQEQGFWNGQGFHGDSSLPCNEWWKLLDRCEETEDI